MIHYNARFITLLFVLSIVVTTAWAAPVVVVNPGFEDISGESPSNEFTFGALNGWELHDPNTVTSDGNGPTFFIGTLTPFEPDPVGNPGVYANFPAGAAEGQRVGIAFNFDGSEGQGEYGFYQELDAALQPHTMYSLTVEIGNIDSATATNGQFFQLAGFPGYRVELLAGGVMLEQDNNSLAGMIPDGEFATSIVSYTTGASHDLLGQNMGILLVNLNQEDLSFPDSDLEVDFDDVRLDALPLLAGDFDLDGDVDGVDFLLWQRGEINSPLELTDWAASYGMVASQAATSTAVPEPTAGILLMLGTVAIFMGRSVWQTELPSTKKPA